MSTTLPAANPPTETPVPQSDGELTRGRITFVESFVPALADGDYEVVVGQRVRRVVPKPAAAVDGTPAPPAKAGDSDAFDEVFVNRHRFRVEGPRFRLEADALRTVFPPPDSLGEYQGTLPHVVLERKTLPWERSADPQGERVPWLALLLFDATDAAAGPAGQASAWQPRTMPVATLAELPANTASYPDLASWEKDDESCQFIDVPLATWATVAPTYDDLRWLAHAREVQDQTAGESAPAGGDLSVVVCNRLPQPNCRATVHLVSLEGLRHLLPDGHGPVTLPAGKDTIRLLSLKSWSFTSHDPEQSFTSHDPEQSFARLLKHASVGPLCVPFAEVPSAPGTADTPAKAAAAVQQAFAMGYTALDHDTRQGTRTVSWYRGPLLPFAAEPAAFEPLVKLGEPVGSADDLLRCDPASGMLDTSYAAAWQLGQLLALNDRGFSTALYEWKNANLQAAALEVEKRVLHERLGAFADLSQAGLMHDHVAAIDHASAALVAAIDPDMPKPAADAGASAEPAHAYHPSDVGAEQFIALVRDPVAWRSIGATTPVPVSVTHWLARLRLLRGVPFGYLVAQETMLPHDSLRFFELDWRWLQALVEGAFSIGRSSHAVSHHDAAFHHVAHPGAVAPAAAPVGDYASRPPAPVSGFLLRSTAVSGWPALQVSAFAAGGKQPLPMLRMVHLSPSVLLYLVEGHVASVLIAEPPEGLHFGVEVDDDGERCVKPLRFITGEQAGTQIGNVADVAVPFRGPRRARVIDIVSLQQRVHDNGDLHHANDDDEHHGPRNFTPAEFALQMVEGVQAVQFQIGE